MWDTLPVDQILNKPFDSSAGWGPVVGKASPRPRIDIYFCEDE